MFTMVPSNTDPCQLMANMHSQTFQARTGNFDRESRRCWAHLVGAHHFSRGASGLHHQGTAHTRRLALTVGHCKDDGVHPCSFHVVAACFEACCGKEVPAHIHRLSWLPPVRVVYL